MKMSMQVVDSYNIDFLESIQGWDLEDRMKSGADLSINRQGTHLSDDSMIHSTGSMSMLRTESQSKSELVKRSDKDKQQSELYHSVRISHMPTAES